jgi:Splicing factor 3B subunit 10 (SF3b10)
MMLNEEIEALGMRLMSTAPCLYFFLIATTTLGSPHNNHKTNLTMSGANPSGGGLDGLTTEQLKARHVGTGHADMSKHEFLVNQHRDTYASLVGHHDQLAYCAVARNE